MSKFKLNQEGNFIEIKVKQEHKPFISQEYSLPTKVSFWSKVASFFYSCFINLKNQVESSMSLEDDDKKFYQFKNYWQEEMRYKDFFGFK